MAEFGFGKYLIVHHVPFFVSFGVLLVLFFHAIGTHHGSTKIGGSRNSQSRDAEFAHMNSPSGFMSIFIVQENIHATRVVTV